MDIVKSHIFFQAWIQTVNCRKDHLKKIWRDTSVFTSYVKGDDNSILEEVAQKLDLLCYPRDYYSIDSILYLKEDMVPLNEGQYCFRDIRVAFEHENVFNMNLREEVSHLLITNSDLKVLVTYPPNDDKENEILNYLHSIIQGARHSKTISQNESFLIIFGYEADLSWEGYVYKDENWKRLTAY
jgi:hypothetical protein